MSTLTTDEVRLNRPAKTPGQDKCVCDGHTCDPITYNMVRVALSPRRESARFLVMPV